MGGYNLYQVATYDTSKNNYVMGVAIVTEEHQIVMALNGASKKWPSSVRTSDNYRLYDGYEITKDVIENHADKLSDADIFYYASNYTFADGSKGYLGSFAEYQMVVQRKDIVNSALSKIGGTEFVESWTSNSHYSDKPSFKFTSSCDPSQGSSRIGSWVNVHTRPLLKLPEGLEW